MEIKFKKHGKNKPKNNGNFNKKVEQEVHPLQDKLVMVDFYSTEREKTIQYDGVLSKVDTRNKRGYIEQRNKTNALGKHDGKWFSLTAIKAKNVAK